ncbi:MAG: alpha-keto acid decarboxylase family protein, partial [Verrucomicrobia bacterium]
RRRALGKIPRPPRSQAFRASPGVKISAQRLFQRLNTFLADNTVVLADVGDPLFGAADLYIHRRTEFLAPAYYTSMGFAVPASIGAQMANPKLRPLVLVGDGAFQMTGMELATAVRYRLNPIVVVFNNAGYGTERPMQDGPYNDVATWRFHRLPEVFGAGRGFLVRTEDELDRALREAGKHTESFVLIEVKLAPNDHSPALHRLTRGMGKQI